MDRQVRTLTPSMSPDEQNSLIQDMLDNGYAVETYLSSLATEEDEDDGPMSLPTRVDPTEVTHIIFVEDPEDLSED